MCGKTCDLHVAVLGVAAAVRTQPCALAVNPVAVADFKPLRRYERYLLICWT